MEAPQLAFKPQGWEGRKSGVAPFEDHAVSIESNMAPRASTSFHVDVGLDCTGPVGAPLCPFWPAAVPGAAPGAPGRSDTKEGGGVSLSSSLSARSASKKSVVLSPSCSSGWFGARGPGGKKAGGSKDEGATSCASGPKEKPAGTGGQSRPAPNESMCACTMAMAIGVIDASSGDQGGRSGIVPGGMCGMWLSSGGSGGWRAAASGAGGSDAVCASVWLA